MYKITYHYKDKPSSKEERFVNMKTADEATRWLLADLSRLGDTSDIVFDEVINADLIYKEHGYDSRDEYLRTLADDYGVDYSTVSHLAQMLGPNEDFDGLVSALEDIDMFGEDYE